MAIPPVLRHTEEAQYSVVIKGLDTIMSGERYAMCSVTLSEIDTYSSSMTPSGFLHRIREFTPIELEVMRLSSDDVPDSEIMRILPVSQHMLEHVRQRSAHTLNSLMPHERRCVSRMYGIADIERFMPARFCAGTEKSNN